MKSMPGWLAALAAAFFLHSHAFAQSPKLVDAYQLLQQHTVADSSKPIELRDGKRVEALSLQNLRLLVEAHRRLADVSNISAKLAIVPTRQPAAMASHAHGMIVFSTGMIELLGKDEHMMAAVMAHEYAHLFLQHGLKRILNIPDAVRRGMAVANRVAARTGDQQVAIGAGQLTAGLLTASYSREQEKEADRVGTELMAKAKYDPAGTVRAIQTILVQIGGRRDTGYFDSHPGIEERLANAAPTVARQQLESAAAALVAHGDWKRLTGVVNRWLSADPENGRAWYYKGLALRAARQDSLPAFAYAVTRDPGSADSRLALCVELYKSGRHRDSLLCAEYLPLNEQRDEFIAATFKHPVLIGMVPGRVITDEDALIIGLALKRPELIPRQAAR